MNRPEHPSASARIVVLLAVLLATAAVLGCPESAAPPVRESSSAEKPLLEPSAFDGVRAYAHVKRMVDFGPRPSGSPAIRRTQEYIQTELKSCGLVVNTMPFVAETPLGSREMLNLTGVRSGTRREVVIIAGHYDTKYFRDRTFVGANDGGSSAAVVLELARILAKGPPSDFTLWFVFFDGEEAVVEWQGNDHTYGSRHYVEVLKSSQQIDRVRALILLDMIGDRQLDIRRESGSTAWMTEIIWKTARELGYGQQFLSPYQQIEDDHVNFIRAGIDSVDLIDFNYGPENSYWHEASDTPDKVSAQSLKIAGDTVARSLPALFDWIKKHAR